MIKTYLFNERETKEDVPLEDWRSLIEGDCKLLWVDVRGVNGEELRRLAELFGLHSVAIDSCLDAYRRPHLYDFADHFYVNLTLVKRSNSASHGVKPSELHLFAGENFIITVVKEQHNDAVDGALKEFLDTPTICSHGSMHAVYLLAEDLIETYFPLVENLDGEADKLETAMMEKADKALVAKLFRLKHRGFELRKLLGPQRDIFNEISRREFPFIHGDNRVYFQDAYSRMIRIFDILDTVREVLSNSLDVYLSSVSNHLNEIMKVLTVAATILMTLSLITGFYGMNFVHLPWLHAPHAFRNICVFMFALMAGMLLWFRRKGWL